MKEFGFDEFGQSGLGWGGVRVIGEWVGMVGLGWSGVGLTELVRLK